MPAADITAVRTNRAVITMICRRLRASLFCNILRRVLRQPLLCGVRSGLQGRRGLCLLQGGAAVRAGAQVLFYKGSGLRTRKPLGIQREKVPHNAAFLIHVDPSMFFRMMVLAR